MSCQLQGEIGEGLLELRYIIEVIICHLFSLQIFVEILLCANHYKRDRISILDELTI